MDNNREDIFYKLINEAKGMKLSDRERSSLFSAVDTFVKKNPLHKAGSSAQPAATKPIKSPFFNQDWFFAFSQRSHNFYLAGALAILAIFGTGTSFAAQNSLPGDVLYPVKVNILEEVKAVFLPSSLKPEYEIERAQARIEEVKQLAQQNKLSEEIKISAAARIDSHISTVKKDISDLQEKGDLKHVLAISNSLETALSESQDTIENFDENSDQEHNPTAEIAFVKDIIRDSREDTVKVREGIEDQIYTQQSNDEDTQEIAQAKLDVTQKALLAIEEKIAKAHAEVDAAQEIEANNQNIELTTQADLAPQTNLLTIATSATDTANTKRTAVVEAVPTVEELVAQAKDLLKQGEEKMNTKEYNEAFRLFREANYVTQIIEFRIGQSGDIGAELDTLLNDINLSDSDVNQSAQDDLTATPEDKI